MRLLRIGFVNCLDLTDSSPATKISDLGAMVSDLFGGQTPDVICLAEVCSRSAAAAVGAATGCSSHELVWPWTGAADAGGPSAAMRLALLYDRTWLQEQGVIVENSGQQRPKWMLAELALASQSGQDETGGLLVCVNHWKSQSGGRPATNDERVEDRGILSATLVERIGRRSGDGAKAFTDSLVMLGDFNCEPWDEPLHGNRWGTATLSTQLHAERQAGPVIGADRNSLYVFNPTWRWMAEDGWPRQGSAVAGTWCPKTGGRRFMFDQAMVSRACLQEGAGFELLRMVRAEPRGGCTDHWAIGVELQVCIGGE